MAGCGKSGIYAITNSIDGKRYVGQAASIARRWSAHRSNLSLGKHANRKLQRAWNKHGAAAFTFVVLEYVPVETLTEREQHWFTILKPEYNLAPAAGSNRGIRISAEHRAALLRAIKGRVVSDEARRKIGEANREHMLGRRHSESTKSKIAAAGRGKLRPDVTAALSGRKRPPHVVEALRAANDSRYAERRERLRLAIAAMPGASNTAVARMAGCNRDTVSKYRRERANREA